MKISKEAIFTAAGILLTIAFVFLCVTIYKKGESSITESTSKYDSLAAQFGDAELVMYDNGTASGSDVLSLISGLDSSKGYTIKVTNGKDKTASYAYAANSTSLDTAIAKAKTKSDDNYINPYASFTSTLTRDGNGVVVSVEFKQVK